MGRFLLAFFVIWLGTSRILGQDTATPLPTDTPYPTATYTPSITPTITPDFYWVITVVAPDGTTRDAAANFTISVGEMGIMMLLMFLVLLESTKFVLSWWGGKGN